MKSKVLLPLLMGALFFGVSNIQCAKDGMEKKCEDDCRRIYRECRKDPSASAKKSGEKLSLCDTRYFRCIRNCSDYPSPKDPL